MLLPDIYSALRWWLTVFIIGIGFLPLTVTIFQQFFDRGYIFSKIIGLILISYTVFVLGIFHFVKFSQITSLVTLCLLAIAFTVFLKNKLILFSDLRKKWKIFLFEEILFFISLFFWAYIHSFNPDIHGLEKFMDFGILNSILRSSYFPPRDMWFTPYPINYYYFGHLITAVITKISGLQSAISFNLMLSTIFAFCFSETFSIGANLYNFMQKKKRTSFIKTFATGLLATALVTFSGNLHILYGFFKSYTGENPVPLWKLPFLPFSFPNSYWYPNATRFIYHTIHEFPIYSWVVADLHGHVLDIPIVLLTIAYLLSFFIAKSEKSTKNHRESTGKNRYRTPKLSQRIWGMFSVRAPFGEIGYLVFNGFLLAVMYMTNAWDGGIYLLLSFFVLCYVYKNAIATGFYYLIAIFLSMILFTLPYSYFFKPFASGIGILCAPSFLTKIGKLGPFIFELDHCQHSYWWQLLILYGFFYFFMILFGFFAFRTKKLLQTDAFVFLLILLGNLLIVIPEFIYLKDIYPAHYRANTMFKLVFQSFMLLSISCSYIIVRLISSLKLRNSNLRTKVFAICYLLFVTSLISLVMTYPYIAINSYYGLDQKGTDGKSKKPIGLDGMFYLKKLYPTDFEAINWLNKNLLNQPVILEAQGDSYTDFARVSANTGLPTVLGWTVHEWLWRGTYDIPAPRINDVKTIYEASDLQATKQLLAKYNISYVFVGALEYQKYPSIFESKFQRLGKVVYKNNGTTIYSISL